MKANDLFTQKIINVNHKFDLWQRDVRPLIKYKLEGYASANPGMAFEENAMISNHETLMLYFKEINFFWQYNPDDFINVQNGNKERVLLNFGSLNFTTTWKGDIQVFIDYPRLSNDWCDFKDILQIKPKLIDTTKDLHDQINTEIKEYENFVFEFLS
jgi:hypothetical protein